ncbi:hypothetical protein [Nostoc phage YongM]|nr:hypothetical protein [Nostoc phage YongM]
MKLESLVKGHSYPIVDFCSSCNSFTGVRRTENGLSCRRCDSGEESLLEIKIEPNKVLEKIIKNTESEKCEFLSNIKGSNRKLHKEQVLKVINSLEEPISLKELSGYFGVSPQGIRRFIRRECLPNDFSACYNTVKREHAIYKACSNDKLLTVLTALWIVFPSRVNIQKLYEMTDINKKEIMRICQESPKIGKEKLNGVWRFYMVNAHNLYLK